MKPWHFCFIHLLVFWSTHWVIWSDFVLCIYISTATQYGEGVYFAVNSSYSVQTRYSPPDPLSGNRKVYQCKVLVGCSVKGHKDMRILPQRSGSNMFYDSATDSIANPTMYVIFNDTQAYPEYMVTFKSMWELPYMLWKALWCQWHSFRLSLFFGWTEAVTFLCAHVFCFAEEERQLLYSRKEILCWVFHVHCSPGLASSHDQLRAVCPTPLIKLASWAYECCKIECVLEGVFLYLAYISMDFCYSVNEFYCLNYRKWYEWRKMGNMQIYVYLYQFIKYIYTFVLEVFMSVTFHC